MLVTWTVATLDFCGWLIYFRMFVVSDISEYRRFTIMKFNTIIHNLEVATFWFKCDLKVFSQHLIKFYFFPIFISPTKHCLCTFHWKCQNESFLPNVSQLGEVRSYVFLLAVAQFWTATARKKTWRKQETRRRFSRRLLFFTPYSSTKYPNGEVSWQPSLIRRRGRRRGGETTNVAKLWLNSGKRQAPRSEWAPNGATLFPSSLFWQAHLHTEEDRKHKSLSSYIDDKIAFHQQGHSNLWAIIWFRMMT